MKATEQIMRLEPPPKVVVVTTFHSQEYVMPALRAGASGYLLKDSPPEEIVDGLRAALQGEFIASPQVTVTLARSIADSVAPVTARAAPKDFGLSAREMEAVELLCTGRSNREMARVMLLAESTVKSHIGRVMEKLGVRDRVQVVITAFRSGLVQL